MLQKLINIPIAHRGLHSNNGIIPENSLAAFQKAIVENYPIEIDVHMLADNEVIVFHDDNAKRMCGLDREIRNLTLPEIKSLRLLESKHEIPTLLEVFDLVNGKVPILIELKNKNKAGLFEQSVLNILKNYNGSIAIQSFNPFSLAWFVKNAPHITRGQLSSSFSGEQISFITKFLLKNMFFNFKSKPHFIAFNYLDLPDRKVNKLRKLGLPILGWTIKSKQEMQIALQNCDNVIFEGFLPNT